MRATFDFALPKILIHEGGKVNHPKDPGGRTNQGVIQRTYDAYRQNKHLPTRTVYDMEDNERDEIYRKQYWDAVKGDILPQGVDYAVFDGAVNSGPGQSIKWLQRALGSLYDGKIDGVIGQGVIAALAMVNDFDALVAEIIKRREAFLKALKTWKTFGKGWQSRINQVLKIGQAWAFGSVGPTPTFFTNGNQKATLADAKPMPVKAVADGAAGGGGAVTVVGGYLESAKETLMPLTGDSAFVSHVVTSLVVAGVLSTFAGLAYRYYAQRTEKRLKDALDLGVAQ
jgi:lysozyme family protein